MNYQEMATKFWDLHVGDEFPSHSQIVGIRIFAKWLEEQAAQQSLHPTNGGLCAVCNKPANYHEDHDYVAPLSAISG